MNMRVFAIALLLVGLVRAAEPAPDCSAVSGWTQKGDIHRFVPEDLFDYMNGNAEGYFLYEFRRLTGATCLSGENTIILDLFEMATPEMAYGIFTANRHPRFETAKIGTAGQLMPRKATFAKGAYYVEVTANKDSPEAIKAFVEALEPAVPGDTELPEPLSWFPAEGLEADSVRLVPQSVLGVRLLERGYIGRYPHGRAFIVTKGDAVELMVKLREQLEEAEPLDCADEAVMGTHRYLRKVAVARKGERVFGIAALKDGADVGAALGAIAAKLP